MGVELFYPVVKEHTKESKIGSLIWSPSTEVTSDYDLFVNENEIWIDNVIFEATLTLKKMTKRSTTSYYIFEDEKGRTFPMDNLRMFELVRDGQISNGKISGYWTFRKGVAKKNTLKYVPSVSINKEVVNYEDWLTLQGLYGLVDTKILVDN